MKIELQFSASKQSNSHLWPESVFHWWKTSTMSIILSTTAAFVWKECSLGFHIMYNYTSLHLHVIPYHKFDDYHLQVYALLQWSLSWHHGNSYLFEQTWQMEWKMEWIVREKKFKNFNKYSFECCEWQN